MSTYFRFTHTRGAPQIALGGSAVENWMRNASPRLPVERVEVVAWTTPSGDAPRGRCVGDHFNGYGDYLGPDRHGVEPIWGVAQ